MGASLSVPMPEIFGEWLLKRTKGRALRLVLEQMNDESAFPAVGYAALLTKPQLTATLHFSSGNRAWPWTGNSNDLMPSITWILPEEVEFLSLKVEQAGTKQWIRRYRVETSKDMQNWEVATPSKLIDLYHRQPCVVENQLEMIESSLLPSSQGTQWFKLFFEDFVLKSVESLDENSPYPDWFSGSYFLSASTRPFAFGGVYNPGDVANFDCLLASIFAPQLAIETEKLFADQINRFGFLPAVLDPGPKDDSGFSLDNTGLNWPPLCYRDIHAWTGDNTFLEWFAKACDPWARWILENRDRNGDGWIEPGTNGCKPASEDYRKRMAAEKPEITRRCPNYWDYVCIKDESMSAFQKAIYELGTDDAPIYVNGRHRGVQYDPGTCSLNVHYIDTQLFMTFLCGFVAYAYRQLERYQEAEAFQEIADHFSSLIKNHCWDEASGFYYDRDSETGTLRTFVKHVGGFLPMLAGIPTQDQAKRLVQHLMNPNEFWTPYPVPSISMDAPDFSPSGYWSGRSWPCYNFIILRGLLNYGFFEEADQLLIRWLAHTKTCIERPGKGKENLEIEGRGIYDARETSIPDITWIVPENWNSLTGAVHGSGGLFWGGLWTAAVIMRHFWPIGESAALLRAGGHFRMKWSTRWDVCIDNTTGSINGRTYRMERNTTYLVNLKTGTICPLSPGSSDPNQL